MGGLTDDDIEQAVDDWGKLVWRCMKDLDDALAEVTRLQTANAQLLRQIEALRRHRKITEGLPT